MNIRVAIIEDEDTIRESLEQLISGSEGFTVVQTFATAMEALEKIPTLVLDVVLTDIHLPIKDGISVVAELKPRFPSIQFLMSTSFDDSETVFNALKAGATGYLTKTTQASKILDAIVEVNKGGSPMSSEIARKIVSYFHTPPKKSSFDLLSHREQEILLLLSKGLRYKEIADKLFLSTETVRTHIRNIYEKLQVNSRTEAINKAI